MKLDLPVNSTNINELVKWGNDCSRTNRLRAWFREPRINVLEALIIRYRLHNLVDIEIFGVAA